MDIVVHGYTETGTISASIEGAEITVPDVPSNRHRQIIAAWEAEGNSIAPYAPPAPTLADYSSAIDAMLDAKAQERQYDSIRTAVTYRDDPNPQFAAEGRALFEWRSVVWTYATAELAKVQDGEREQPSVAVFMTEIEAECPFAWPAA